MTRLIRCSVFATAIAAWLAAAPVARGESCDSVLQRLDTTSVYALDCSRLRTFDDTLRRCTAAQPPEALAIAHWEVRTALRRCPCSGVRPAAQLLIDLDRIATALAAAKLESELSYAERCVSDDAQDERQGLAKVRTALRERAARAKQAEDQGAACQALGFDPAARSKASRTATASQCYAATLEHAAFERWLGCSRANAGASGGDTTRKALEDAETKACGRTPPPAPTCDETLVSASELQRVGGDAAQRRLWNLVATQLLAAGGARATREERECATRMIATATSDGTNLEAIIEDPVLHRQLALALKNFARADTLARLLAEGADVKRMLEQVVSFSEEDRRRFFNLTGSLGQARQAALAFAAYEQSARGFDVVIAPAPDRCKYSDFVNVLAAGFSRPEPAKVEIVAKEGIASTVEGLVEGRMRSCGSQAPDAARGPGCGAVIAVQVHERDASHATGTVQLHFVSRNNEGKAKRHEIHSVEIPEFRPGCGPESQEAAVAAQLAYDLQYEFAKTARDTAVYVGVPVPAEFCRLRRVPSTIEAAAPHDKRGLHVESVDSRTPEASATKGARETLRAWEDDIGKLDAPAATASVRFGSEPDVRESSVKLHADLLLRGRPAASFSAVVMSDAPDCPTSFAERQVQAGRMLGDELGSYLAQHRPGEGGGQRRRWLAPTLFAAGEVALVAGGLLFINRGVTEENRAVASGMDRRASNASLTTGRVMLGTAALGALVGAILAAR